MTEPREPLLEFPCAFPIKAIGTGVADFERVVMEIIPRHVPASDVGEVECRPSGAGTYLAVTVTFTARSQDQIDGLYRELSAHERVVIVL